MHRLLISLFSVLLLSVTAAAQEPGAPGAAEQAEPGTLDLTQVRTNLLFATNTGGDTFTGEVAWTPEYPFTEDLSARLNLGLSLFGGVDSDFLVLSYGAIGTYRLTPMWAVEALAGLQTWTEGGGTFFHAGANVNYLLQEPLWGIVDRVIAGYSFVTTPDVTSQIRAGVGWNF